MSEEFDSLNQYYPNALNGWFDGFCPSNGIADNLNRQSAGVRAQKTTWDKKYTALKNGKQAAEWESLKREVRRLESEIKTETQKLSQETAIADALGLGAWCNGAVSKRKKAEESLRSAEKALGHIKGAFETLERQQREGIREASKVIQENQKKITAIKSQIVVIKKKIAAYKAKRDNDAKEDANASASDNKEIKKQNIVGKLKENAPLIGGGLGLIALLIYLRKSKKTTKASARAKAVTM